MFWLTNFLNKVIYIISICLCVPQCYAHYHVLPITMILTHFVLNIYVLSVFIIDCFISYNCVANVVFSSFTDKKQEFSRSQLKHSLLNTIFHTFALLTSISNKRLKVLILYLLTHTLYLATI